MPPKKQPRKPRPEPEMPGAEDDDLTTAEKLFRIYQEVKRVLVEQGKPIDDPNIFTVALTEASPKFGSRYPIVVKTIALRGQFFSRAFSSYLSYLRNVTVDRLTEQHLERITGRKKAPVIEHPKYELKPLVETYDETGAVLETNADEFEEALAGIAKPHTKPTEPIDNETMFEARLQARAEIDGYYVYLTLVEAAKRDRPHDWRSCLPTNAKEGLASEVYQELKITEEKNAEAMRQVQEEKAEDTLERRRHLSNWFKRAAAKPGYSAEFARLHDPIDFRSGAGADVDEYRGRA